MLPVFLKCCDAHTLGGFISLFNLDQTFREQLSSLEIEGFRVETVWTCAANTHIHCLLPILLLKIFSHCNLQHEHC